MPIIDFKIENSILKHLKEFGFDDESSARELIKAGGNFQVALETLIT